MKMMTFGMQFILFALTLLLSCGRNQTYLAYTSGVRCVLHDSKGNYWFGSHQEGACRFDGRSFIYYTKEDGLCDNQVRTIDEDSNGNIWFGTANGVALFDGTRITCSTSGDVIPDSPFETDRWPTDGDHLFFAAGMMQGVYKTNGSELTYHPLPSPAGSSELGPSGVTSISRGLDDRIWIATYTAVYGYDGSSFDIINDESLGNMAPYNLHVRSILADTKGRLWIGNNGIGVLLSKDGSTTNFTKQMGLNSDNIPGGISTSPAGTLEHVFAIAEDDQGNIWFGDRDTGIWKYDGTTMMNYLIEDGLPSQHIWSICQDRNKEMLFATAAGGVYCLRGGKVERKF